MADFGPTTVNGDIDIRGSMGGAIRVAYVDGTPGAVSSIDAFLDTDTNGEPITVICSIVDGTTLNTATPRLVDGDAIFVARMQDAWYCLSLFFESP